MGSSSEGHIAKTIVVNIRQYDPTLPGRVLIDRRTKWGNPFPISNVRGEGDSRADVIRKYRAWIQGQPELMAALPELKGKVLVCWCAPLPCHGQVLAELAELADGG